MKLACIRALAFAGALFLPSPLALAQATRTISFQGRLTNAAGTPLPDGPQAVTFRLYDGPAGPAPVTGEPHVFQGNTITLRYHPVLANSETLTKADGSINYVRGNAYTVDYSTGVVTRASASTIPDGTQVTVSYQVTAQYTANKLWEETKSVTLKGGGFTTALGDTTAFPASLGFGEPLYLALQVGSDPEMYPRVALSAAPSALSLPLPYAESTITSGTAFTVTSNGLDSVDSNAIHGVLGDPSGRTGGGAAVWGDSYYLFGILGTSNRQAGVTGVSATGPGMYGTSNANAGVFGSSQSATSYGAWGEDDYGGTGVGGYSGSTTGSGVGVLGKSLSGGGTGVIGEDLNGGTGVFGHGHYGVQGISNSTGGTGVYGDNSAGGASVAGRCAPFAKVGVFAGDLGPFGTAGFETNFTSPPAAHIWCAESGQEVFSVTAGGYVCGLGFTQCSDARYKQDVQTLPDPLDTVLSLRGVSFEWDPKDAGRTFPEGRQIGFIAQEVEKVLPEVVSTDRSGYKSVAYQNIVPVLVEAVKAQQKEIESLRAEEAAERAKAARADDLEARLKRLEALAAK